MTHFKILAVAALAVVPPLSAAAAQDTPLGGEELVTEHSGTFNGIDVDYTATVGEIVITDADGAPAATISSTAYLRTNAGDTAERPVIFIWNGGPSAAARPLHMAGFGPKRLVIPSDVTAPIEPPYRLGDNADTVLDVADLIFVDPVETGLSRLLPGGNRAYFYSDQGDAESVAQYIENWLQRHERTNSPTYIMGASYGSVRAALVAGVLAASDNPLEGVILVSQGVNLIEVTQRRRNLMGFASNLSQVAAIAHFHGMTEYQDLPVRDLIDRVYDYSMNVYLPALAAGRFLPEDAKAAVAGQLAAFTGLDAETLLAKDLRFTKPFFLRALLKKKGLALAASDARYAYPADAESAPNPLAGLADVHALQMEALSAGDLLDAYQPFAPGAGNWDYVGSTVLGWRKSEPGSPRTIFIDYDWTGELAAAFEANAAFRLMITTGMYDTLTTTGPARLLAADPAFAGKPVMLREYEGGHAFYSDPKAFSRLAADVRAFLGD